VFAICIGWCFVLKCFIFNFKTEAVALSAHIQNIDDNNNNKTGGGDHRRFENRVESLIQMAKRNFKEVCTQFCMFVYYFTDSRFNNK
jgi:hypothetical protein